MSRNPAVYILANKHNGTLYIGVTSDLMKRVWEHKQDMVEGFTRKYEIHTLVYFEQHDEMEPRRSGARSSSRNGTCVENRAN
jgi:putative endonuclease